MLRKYFNNTHGMALVVVLMILAVLSILSVSTLNLTTSETKLSIEDKEEINSYAISKSGLEIVAKKLKKNPGSITMNDTIWGTLIVGTYSVVPSGSIAGTVNLTSTGEINGNSETTVLTLENKTDEFNLFQNAVYANNPLELKEVDVDGPIQSAGTITKPKNPVPYPDEVKPNSPIICPVFPLPTSISPQIPASVTIGNGNGNVPSFPITDSNRYYERIEIKNGKKLTLGTLDSTASINLVVDNLIIDGDLVVLSKVKLYVKNTMNIQTQGTVNGGAGADPNNLYIFLGTPNLVDQDDPDPKFDNVDHPEDLIDGFNPNGYFTTQAGQTINAYIYGPAALVQTNSSNVIVSGGIISNEFIGNNGSEIEFVPPNDPAGMVGTIDYLVKQKYTDQ